MDALVRDGYKNAGYEYVIIDDCWPEMERSSEGLLVPDRIRFPSGMKALSDYVQVYLEQVQRNFKSKSYYRFMRMD